MYRVEASIWRYLSEENAPLRPLVLKTTSSIKVSVFAILLWVLVKELHHAFVFYRALVTCYLTAKTTYNYINRKTFIQVVNVAYIGRGLTGLEHSASYECRRH